MESIHEGDEQGFIPFIHNWCDRWCEKCRFARQCRVGISVLDDVEREDYASGHDAFKAKMMKDAGLSEEEFDKLMEEEEEEEYEENEGEEWNQNVTEMAAEPDLELEKWKAEHDKQHAAIALHPLSALTQCYIELMGAWYDAHKTKLKEKGLSFGEGPDLVMATTLGSPKDMILKEAVEELLWFKYMLHVKVQRALRWKFEEDDDLGDDVIQSDMNGTAKLVLHIIDRCTVAWMAIGENWQEVATTTIPFVAHLAQCDRQLRKEFPDAERFIRPGFDKPTA